jgi:hypothetical protein
VHSFSQSLHPYSSLARLLLEMRPSLVFVHSNTSAPPSLKLVPPSSLAPLASHQCTPLQALLQSLRLPSQDAPKLHQDVPPSRFSPLLSRCALHLAHTHNLHESLSKLACALYEQVRPSFFFQTLSSHFSFPHPILSSDQSNNESLPYPFASFSLPLAKPRRSRA